MSSSRKSIYARIAANLAIARVKIVGFAFTRSSAMLSEAIHFFVDCGNGALLLVSQHQSAKPADETHSFGYGKELYSRSLPPSRESSIRAAYPDIHRVYLEMDTVRQLAPDPHFAPHS